MKAYRKRLISLATVFGMAAAQLTAASTVGADRVFAKQESQKDYNASLFGAMDREDSYIFSPYSIMDCLTLCYDGLSDKAKKSLAAQGVTEKTVESFKAFDKQANSGKLSVANKVYLNKTVKGGFQLDLIRKDSVEEVNMGAQAAKSMNQWVADKTHNKIQNLIPEGAVGTDLAMVLINAIYMKRGWLDDGYENEKLTWKNDKKYKDFSGRADAGAVRDIGDYSVLRLPYVREQDKKGGVKNAIAMFAITENDTIGKKDGEIAPFTPDTAMKYVKAFQKQKAPTKYDEVHFHMPSYEINYKDSVLSALKKIGLGDVLTGGAYKKIGPMQVGEVYHGAYIKTNKNGTEAAAATSMMMELTAAPDEKPPVVREIYFDKPFYFVIQDTVSGIVLFEGKVNADSLKSAK